MFRHRAITRPSPKFQKKPTNTMFRAAESKKAGAGLSVDRIAAPRFGPIL